MFPHHIFFFNGSRCSETKGLTDHHDAESENPRGFVNKPFLPVFRQLFSQRLARKHEGLLLGQARRRRGLGLFESLQNQIRSIGYQIAKLFGAVAGIPAKAVRIPFVFAAALKLFIGWQRNSPQRQPGLEGVVKRDWQPELAVSVRNDDNINCAGVGQGFCLAKCQRGAHAGHDIVETEKLQRNPVRMALDNQRLLVEGNMGANIGKSVKKVFFLEQRRLRAVFISCLGLARDIPAAEARKPSGRIANRKYDAVLEPLIFKMPVIGHSGKPGVKPGLAAAALFVHPVDEAAGAGSKAQLAIVNSPGQPAPFKVSPGIRNRGLF